MSQRLADKPIWTYVDYCVLPQDHSRHEIIEGDHIVTPSPTSRHQKTLANLQFLLDSHIRSLNLGTLLAAPMDVVLAETSVVQPDLLFVIKSREQIITEPYVDGPPDLIVEVLSPSTSAIDRSGKMRLYSKYGVRHYWIVDPDRPTLEMYELQGNAYQLRARVETGNAECSLLPGLRISIADLAK